MRLWRLTTKAFTALDGAGPLRHGARYSSPGKPVVNFTAEPGLAVLVALRYLPDDLAGVQGEYVLGWTDVDAIPERLPPAADDFAKQGLVDGWLDSRQSLLATVQSAVLPESDIVMMNPLHEDAARVAPLTTRPFSFSECLHTPPMARIYGSRK